MSTPHTSPRKAHRPSGRKRRSLALLLILAVPVLGFMLGAAAAGPAGPRIVDNDQGTHIAFSVPGFLVRAAARWIPDAPDEARVLMRHVRGLRVEVREGDYHPARGDAAAAGQAFARTLAQRERQGYTPLMRVRSADERIAVDAVLGRGDRIRKLAITADDGESFVQLRLKTNIGPEALGEVLEATGFDRKRMGLAFGEDTPEAGAAPGAASAPADASGAIDG